MSKARGHVEAVELKHLGGLNTEVFQPNGSATDIIGAVFALDGSVRKANGVSELVDLNSTCGDNRIHSIGRFTHGGITDILVAYGTKVGVLQGAVSGGGLDIIDLITGLEEPPRPRDAVRFVQVADVVLIMNGRDANQKWDGRLVSDIGIHGTPAPPVATLYAEAAADSGLYPVHSIEKVADEVRYRYKVTWENDKGQESEASAGSDEITDDDVTVGVRYVIAIQLDTNAPADDTTGRIIYRSTDGGLTYDFLKRIRGVQSSTYWDGLPPGSEAADTLPVAGTNSAPGVAQWAFLFRGRTYYFLPANPGYLHYSRPDGQKEAVSTTNLLDVNSSDGESVTGYALDEDYALIFKPRSIFMLTHDKTETPVLTPIARSVGAVSDRAVTAFEGSVYFLGRDGLYVFRQGRAQPVSKELNGLMRMLPPTHLPDAVMWMEPTTRRVMLSLYAGPGAAHNEVWGIHIDTGGVTRMVGAEITGAVPYGSDTMVAYHETNTKLGLWDGSNSLGSGSFTGRFETRWLHLGNPNADKRFHRLDVYYLQTGTHNLVVDWSVDWDARAQVGTANVKMSDPGAASYDTGEVWATDTWDSNRLRSARVDLAPTAEGNEGGTVGKAILIGWQTAGANEPWIVVGFKLWYSELGDRAGGLDDEGNL